MAASTEIPTASMRRRRTVAAWQVPIKEPLNRRLVEALDCKPGPTHPPRKMRDGVDVIRSGAARVAAPRTKRSTNVPICGASSLAATQSLRLGDTRNEAFMAVLLE